MWPSGLKAGCASVKGVKNIAVKQRKTVGINTMLFTNQTILQFLRTTFM